MGRQVMLQTSYLQQLFDFDKTEIVIKAFKKAKEIAKFDAIVVTGVSGVGLGSVISHATKTPMLIVRKKTDNSHSGYKLEGHQQSDWNYCFFDDLVASGATFNNVAESIGYEKILEELAKKYQVEHLIKRKNPIEGSKTDPAHPSIYPTGQSIVLTGDEERLYNLIVKRLLL
jgi:hypothetical protein